jgi:hypothetical protein
MIFKQRLNLDNYFLYKLWDTNINIQYNNILNIILNDKCLAPLKLCFRRNKILIKNEQIYFTTTTVKKGGDISADDVSINEGWRNNTSLILGKEPEIIFVIERFLMRIYNI